MAPLSTFKPSQRDYIFFSGLLWGILAITCTATMPLREAKSEIRGWPSRTMKLGGQGDVVGVMQPWAYWRKETCDSYILAKDKLSSGASVKQANTMAETKIPGIAIQCTTFPGCFRHAGVRCSWYKAIEASYGMTLGLQVSGLVLYGIACLVVAMGMSMRIVTALGTLGSIMVITGLYLWMILTDAFLNALRVQVYWPYASISSGGILGGVLGVVMLCTSLTSITLVFHQNKRKKVQDDYGEEEYEDEEEEEWDE